MKNKKFRNGNRHHRRDNGCNGGGWRGVAHARGNCPEELDDCFFGGMPLEEFLKQQDRDEASRAFDREPGPANFAATDDESLEQSAHLPRHVILAREAPDAYYWDRECDTRKGPTKRQVRMAARLRAARRARERQRGSAPVAA